MPGKVKVFIGWSQPRSKAVAVALDEWLPQVIQTSVPWLSEDIDRGSQWFDRIGANLKAADYGILCVTPENQNERWVLFEAGALAMRTSERLACPYLLDMTPTTLAPPLGLLQAATADKEGTRKVVETINGLVDPDLRLSDENLQRSFDTWWPQLEKKLDEARKIEVPAPKPLARSDTDKLDEILGIVREMQRAGGRGPQEAALEGLPALPSLTPTRAALLSQIMGSLGYGAEASTIAQDATQRRGLLPLLDQAWPSTTSTPGSPRGDPSKPAPSTSGRPRGNVSHLVGKPKKR